MHELKQDVKDIKADILEIKITTAANTASLEAHMSRTELNERRVEKLEKWHLGLLATILAAMVVKALLG
jgi:hypothetical protein